MQTRTRAKLLLLLALTLAGLALGLINAYQAHLLKVSQLYSQLADLDQQLDYMVWPQDRGRIITQMQQLLNQQARFHYFSPKLHQDRVAIALLEADLVLIRNSELNASLDYLLALRESFPTVKKFLRQTCQQNQAPALQQWCRRTQVHG